MRRLLLLPAIAVFAIGGCGEPQPSGTTQNLPELPEQGVRTAFLIKSDCRHPAGASRWGCQVGPYRCQGVVTGRGWSISCSKPGETISFRLHPR